MTLIIFAFLVVVVLLLAAMPKRKPKDLDKKLEDAVESWGDNNAPFIFKTLDYVSPQNTVYTQGFRLLQDPKSYISLVNQKLDKSSPDWVKYAKYSKGNHITGKFLDMPSYKAMTENDFEISLGLEQRHFDNMGDSIMQGIAVAIKLNCKDIAPPAKLGVSRTMKLSCSKISSEADISSFVESLDFIVSLVKVIA